MSQNEIGKSHTGVTWALFLGLAIAIGGNIYESMGRDNLTRDLARVQVSTEQQMAKVNDTTKGALLESKQRLDALESQMEGTSNTNLRQVRSELKKTNNQLADGVEQKSQQLMSQLSDLRVDTSEKLGRVSGDIESTGADVKRVEGDLNAVSGAVATNAQELSVLKELGERNYFEFALGKTKAPQKVGDIRLVLKKTDPKHNRYTVEVLADDKKVEKKDRTVNEPVQLYLSGSAQAYEIVVNQVKKNQVVGYVAVPKVKLARGQTS
jgi:hypothetical protein